MSFGNRPGTTSSAPASALNGNFKLTAATVPEKLSEQDARAIIDAHRPEHDNLANEHTRFTDRAEQGQKTVEALLATLKEKYGVSTPEEAQAKLDELMLNNGSRVQNYLRAKEACMDNHAAIKRAANLS